ncbi:MAG: apolipoprotein N-acyltransferase [Desulfococcaceae bacterium]
MKNLTNFAFSIVAGLLLTAAFPRTGAWPLAGIALAPLLVAIRNAGPAEAFRMGWVAGMAHALTLVYWIAHTLGAYGGLPVWVSVPVLGLLAAYLALYPAAFAAVLRGVWTAPALSAPTVPMVWTALEYVRAHLLTGFPWALLGYAPFRQLHPVQISDIVGVYGVSFLLVSINSAFALGWMAIRKLSWGDRAVDRRTAGAAGVLAIALTLGTLAYGHFRLDQIEARAEEAPVTRAAVVQGNIEQAVKWDPAHQERTVEKYVALSLAAMADRPDLVVWPETAAPFYFLHNRPMTARVLEGVREAGAFFIVGSPSFERGPESMALFNSAFLIRPDGRLSGRYDKHHLVPFGEYVPLGDFFPFLDTLVAQVGNFRSGTKGEVLHADGHRPGVLICYEGIFPALARAAVLNRAGLLVNITNDAWYGRSSAPYQHFSMAVLRAVETRRGLVRAANTGISGFIHPTGRIDGTTGLFEDAVATRALPVMDKITIYTRIGDLFAQLCVAGTLILGIIRLCQWRRKTK